MPTIGKRPVAISASIGQAMRLFCCGGVLGHVLPASACVFIASFGLLLSSCFAAHHLPYHPWANRLLFIVVVLRHACFICLYHHPPLYTPTHIVVYPLPRVVYIAVPLHL